MDDEKKITYDEQKALDLNSNTTDKFYSLKLNGENIILCTYTRYIPETIRIRIHRETINQKSEPTDQIRTRGYFDDEIHRHIRKIKKDILVKIKTDEKVLNKTSIALTAFSACLIGYFAQRYARSGAKTN